MTSFRRVAILIGLTLGVIIGASIPASAIFAESVTVKPAVATGTVAAPTSVTINDWCITTTITTTRTVRTDPATGIQTQTAWSRTYSDATSSTNVDSYTSSSVPGPHPLETTTTTVDKNTALHVSAAWSASGSRGVTGYTVAAHLSNGTAYTMAGTAGTSMSGQEDADALWYSPRLSVTTVTSYNWTATSAQTRVLAC